MPTPIFVLGKHRSGTTWLANQLCQHPLISGITHEKHQGIHESAYFNCIYNRYGNLLEYNNFIEFVEVVGESDYFRLAGVEKKWLYSLWPITYQDVFRKVMDLYADKNEALYWVEKSPAHTLWINKIACFYPDAKFISIERDVEEVVTSSLANLGDSGKPKWLRKVFIVSVVLSWTFYNKTLHAFVEHKKRLHTISYKNLCSDLKTSMQNICHFLNIHFDSNMCVQAFIPNTNLKKTQREKVLSVTEKIMVRLAKYLFRVTPLWVLQWTYKFKEINRKRTLPSWFFKLHPYLNNKQISV